MDSIFHRVSIRKYKEQKVEQEKIAHCTGVFEIDMSAAVENLLLQADALGLGAVWMGIAPDQGRMDAVRKVLDIPENLHAFALVPCGYPAEERAQEDRYDVNRVHYVG